MKTVAVSGFFDPLHVGHIELFRAAKQLGDRLVVIVNNDASTKAKKGYIFMPAKDRMRLIQELKMVDEVIASVDEGPGVAYTLVVLQPTIFAKGPDYNQHTLPENELIVCEEQNIQVVYGVGGPKIQSSSTLVKGGWEEAIDQMRGRSFDL